MNELLPLEHIKNRIFLLRGYKVMISSDLASLYDVEPRALIQAVRRNRDRFPEDFMFQLTWEETSALETSTPNWQKTPYINSRSQIVILKHGKNIKHLPYAVTEQGVAMLSSVLRSRRAVKSISTSCVPLFTFENYLVQTKILPQNLRPPSIRQLIAPAVRDKVDTGFK